MSELRLSLSEPEWTEVRERAALEGVWRRRRARRVQRGVALLLMLIACALGYRARMPEVVRFADGSTAELRDRHSALALAAPEAGVLATRLEAGEARFSIVRDETRRFRVQAGEVMVEVLGTQFTVERLGAGARVAVERGRVRVSWKDGAVELAAGQTGLYPPRDEVALLFAAADAARVAGRPADALAPLSRVIDAHARDPRAPLAAFTLGRLYLDELDRPRDAAAAFARARSLDPAGPLAADARVREAEARARK
jgi:ferric-dicitrate binding protein FerR (iron transport regulator)